MKARVLSFGSLSSTLAKNQNQVLIDLVNQEIPRLACQLTVLPSNQNDEENENQVFKSRCQKSEVVSIGTASVGET